MSIFIKVVILNETFELVLSTVNPYEAVPSSLHVLTFVMTGLNIGSTTGIVVVVVVVTGGSGLHGSYDSYSGVSTSVLKYVPSAPSSAVTLYIHCIEEPYGTDMSPMAIVSPGPTNVLPKDIKGPAISVLYCTSKNEAD